MEDGPGRDRDRDAYYGGQFSDEERRCIRRLLDDDRRTRWIYGSLYRIVIAMGAVAAALTAVKVFIAGYLFR